jgi:hypothetical protein
VRERADPTRRLVVTLEEVDPLGESGLEPEEVERVRDGAARGVGRRPVDVVPETDQDRQRSRGLERSHGLDRRAPVAVRIPEDERRALG